MPNFPQNQNFPTNASIFYYTKNNNLQIQIQHCLLPLLIDNKQERLQSNSSTISCSIKIFLPILTIFYSEKAIINCNQFSKFLPNRMNHFRSKYIGLLNPAVLFGTIVLIISIDLKPILSSRISLKSPGLRTISRKFSTAT